MCLPRASDRHLRDDPPHLAYQRGDDNYKKAVPPSIAAFGGRYLARGGRTEVLEGGWTPKRLVILEFAEVERAKAWLNSPEYREARAMRHEAARSNMVVIEGVS